MSFILYSWKLSNGINFRKIRKSAVCTKTENFILSMHGCKILTIICCTNANFLLYGTCSLDGSLSDSVSVCLSVRNGQVQVHVASSKLQLFRFSQ